MSQNVKIILSVFLVLSVILHYECCFYSAVLRKIRGMCLPKFAFKTLKTNGELDCTMNCLMEKLCVSVNFKISGEEQGLCELNNGTLKEASGEPKLMEFNYFEIVNREPKDKTELFSKKMNRFMSYPHTCSEILLEKERSHSNGVYKLQNKDSFEVYDVYCHMTEISGCGYGGWTLVMKIDGKKNEFNYNSSYWTNKKTFAIEDGLAGLTDKQTKLASYWNTPFDKICLGMKVDGITKWISIDYQASSLHSVIASKAFKTTTAGKDIWKSLITGSALQENCNEEGFNLYKSYNHQIHGYMYMNVRIGIKANNQNNCYSCDSCIGFGISVRGCQGVVANSTCGNIGVCGHISDRKTTAFGYILVQ